MTDCGASPGRSSHRMSLEAARIVFDTRESIAELFHVFNSDRVVFSHNATYAINAAIKGILKQGDHVIISSMEHNSVIRPLRHLEKMIGIKLSIVDCDRFGHIHPHQIQKAFQANTKMVITTHGSNVNGVVFPVSEIGKICRAAGVTYILDAAQTAGFLPINMEEDCIDVLAFTGHKKLYGPTGTGGLCLAKHIELDSFAQGGTGSRSEEDIHPVFFPDKMEAGTLNTAGIAGLKAGIDFIRNQGMQNIRNHLSHITTFFINELRKIDEITVHCPENEYPMMPVISVSSSLLTPDQLSNCLDMDYGIMTRPGLHCSPLAHKSIGTFPQGTVRFSPGYFQTEEQIIFTIQSLKTIFKNKNF